MTRDEQIDAVVRALGKWSCWHQDDPPRDERHEWLWSVATIAVDTLAGP